MKRKEKGSNCCKLFDTIDVNLQYVCPFHLKSWNHAVNLTVIAGNFFFCWTCRPFRMWQACSMFTLSWQSACIAIMRRWSGTYVWKRGHTSSDWHQSCSNQTAWCFVIRPVLQLASFLQVGILKLSPYIIMHAQALLWTEATCIAWLPDKPKRP